MGSLRSSVSVCMKDDWPSSSCDFLWYDMWARWRLCGPSCQPASPGMEGARRSPDDNTTTTTYYREYMHLTLHISAPVAFTCVPGKLNALYDYYAVTMHAAGYVTTKPRHNVRFLIRPLKKQISTRRDNALVRERNVQVALHCVICPETSFHALWIVICTYVHAWIDVHVLVWFLPGRWPIISGQPLLLMLSIDHRSISRPVSFCHYS
jgi:hypothetical protein